jgi:hypothetical protein
MALLMDRRGFVGSLIGALAAPALIRPGLLMRVSTLALPTYGPGGLLTMGMIAAEFNRRLQRAVPSEISHANSLSRVEFNFDKRDLTLSLEDYGERYLAPAAAGIGADLNEQGAALSIGVQFPPVWGVDNCAVNDRGGVSARAMTWDRPYIGKDRVVMTLDVLHS